MTYQNKLYFKHIKSYCTSYKEYSFLPKVVKTPSKSSDGNSMYIYKWWQDCLSTGVYWRKCDKKLAPYGTDGQLFATERFCQVQSHVTQKRG